MPIFRCVVLALNLGTRAEIKNVNSVRFLGQALEYEIRRQLEILEDGGMIVQETRLFDPGKGETRSMRGKENAHDYRYFPDPDLRPLVLTIERVEKIKATLPELPDAKRARFITDYGLTDYDASVLVAEQEVATYYEKVVGFLKSKDIRQAAKLTANWLIGEVFGALNRESLTIEQVPFPPQYLAKLVDLITDDTISGKIAKDVFAKLWETGEDPAQIVEKLGLRQITDTSAIEAIIAEIMEKNADQVEEYRSGKPQLLGHFVGQVMKATQGKANPGIVNKILQEKLNG